MHEAPILISLGKITKPQGIKGAFRVHPHGGESENLESFERITLAPPQGEPVEVRVLSRRRKGNLIIFQVEGVDSIDKVEKYIGGEVLAPEADLAPLDEGEFYWYEVVGMEVVTDTGENLGKVTSLLATGANDVLEVRRGRQEILLPNIPDVILDIDRDNGRITVHLLPGLR